MVKISELAIERMRDVVRQQDTEGIAVRLFVESSHGQIGYGMGLDNEIAEDDTVVDLEGIRLVVDSDSMPYIEGAEIDYVESLMNTGFTVSNPNFVQSAGGCGQSAGACHPGGGAHPGGGSGHPGGARHTQPCTLISRACRIPGQDAA